MMQHTALLVGSYPICIRATTAGNTKRMNEQVSHGVSNVVLPFPNPPLRKVRGLDFLLSPLSKLRCTHISRQDAKRYPIPLNPP